MMSTMRFKRIGTLILRLMIETKVAMSSYLMLMGMIGRGCEAEAERRLVRTSIRNST
jgi:hypothetical protein